ncbi:MAG: hypothetical protein K9M57_07855 [Phycisphaerae bacterium]|nr:hypothetical protein [Phycisphaerae bacterium]
MSKAISLTLGLSLGLFAIFSTGCATVNRSREEQIQKYSRMAELNRMMIAEDIDKYLFMERPSRLSEWHITGY